MRLIIAICLLVSVMALGPPTAAAQSTTLETLHGFCGPDKASTTCSDNGTITPTPSLTTFGFWRSPDNNDGWIDPKIWVVFLIPDPVALLSFTVSGVTPVVPATTVTSNGLWNSGDFNTFIGLTQNGGPTNPIGAFLPLTQALTTGVTGYDVYTANMGPVDFTQSYDPTFTTSLTAPVGTIVFAYITDASGDMRDSTANSGSLLVTGVAVPEPLSIITMGTVILLVGGFARKKLARASR